MAVYRRKDSNGRPSRIWWYKFNWNGKSIRESTKQTNKRIAEQMEAAHKTALAKGEVGIREQKDVPTLRQFASDFLGFVASAFPDDQRRGTKNKTRAYYEYGVKALMSFDPLARQRLDAITSETVGAYVAQRQAKKLTTATLNRELQVLRRMFALSMEWGRVEKPLPRVRMLAGEAHRERVLSAGEEAMYLGHATPLLYDVAIILLDCGLRPEECFRLRWANILDGLIEIHYGKTDNARRRIPMSDRVSAVLNMRRGMTDSEWVFPAPTKSGHIEPSSLKRPQVRACKGNVKERGKWMVQPFTLYTFRHTCLTRWAASGMDPWTLAYLAGHRDMSITKRYVHPQPDAIQAAMDRARMSTALVSQPPQDAAPTCEHGHKAVRAVGTNMGTPCCGGE